MILIDVVTPAALRTAQAAVTIGQTLLFINGGKEPAATADGADDLLPRAIFSFFQTQEMILPDPQVFPILSGITGVGRILFKKITVFFSISQQWETIEIVLGTGEFFKITVVLPAALRTDLKTTVGLKDKRAADGADMRPVSELPRPVFPTCAGFSVILPQVEIIVGDLVAQADEILISDLQVRQNDPAVRYRDIFARPVAVLVIDAVTIGDDRMVGVVNMVRKVDSATGVICFRTGLDGLTMLSIMRGQKIGIELFGVLQVGTIDQFPAAVSQTFPEGADVIVCLHYFSPVVFPA